MTEIFLDHSYSGYRNAQYHLEISHTPTMTSYNYHHNFLSDHLQNGSYRSTVTTYHKSGNIGGD